MVCVEPLLENVPWSPVEFRAALVFLELVRGAGGPIEFRVPVLVLAVALGRSCREEAPAEEEA